MHACMLCTCGTCFANSSPNPMGLNVAAYICSRQLGAGTHALRRSVLCLCLCLPWCSQLEYHHQVQGCGAAACCTVTGCSISEQTNTGRAGPEERKRKQSSLASLRSTGLSSISRDRVARAGVLVGPTDCVHCTSGHTHRAGADERPRHSPDLHSDLLLARTVRRAASACVSSGRLIASGQAGTHYADRG
jgi:hypothetical protein